MVRSIIHSLAAGLLVACFSVGLAQTQSPGQTSQQATNRVNELYTCPMHPEVQSDKADKCPQCGMKLVRKETSTAAGSAATSEKIESAKKMLRDAVGKMVQDGSYKCCIELPCLQCALDHYTCPCYSDLKKGKAVCNECYGGWQRGEGKDKTIKSKDVKTSYGKHKH
jgi:hypothetical protein